MGSYVLWFPMTLALQFNLMFGGPRTKVLAQLFSLGRWCYERRTSAINALNFGDADDDDLESVPKPWRVFESVTV